MIRPAALAVLLFLVFPPCAVHAQNPRAVNVVSLTSAPVETEAKARENDAAIQRLLSRNHPDSSQLAIDLIRRRFETGCSAGFDHTKPATWLGLRNDVAECIWNQDGVEGLDLTNVAAGTRSGSIYSDLVAMYFGPLRATLATMIAAATEDDGGATTPEAEATEEARTALQRLVNGGGNLLLTAELPLLRLQLPRVNGFDLVLSGSGRAATNTESLGASQSDSASSLAGAFNAQLNLWSNNRQVRVFGHWRSEYIRGDGDLLQEPEEAAPSTLQEGEEPETPSGTSLGYSRLQVGALLWDAVLVTWTRPFFCGECEDLDIGSQVSISFQKEQ